ncbi:hypothetical protein LCGC14_1111810 [marine sediment metagenome]|uniref:Uncharacterized protein n=1 Tax=marine sediment metagenome TaxID=412755 RepID=A0A0F9M6E9_9ZZZZ
MSYKQVAQGNFLDLRNLGNFDSAFEEGQRGRLELNLRATVPSGMVRELDKRLRAQGVEGLSVTGSSRRVDIKFRKGFPWLAVIAATILALAILAVLIMGWTIFKEVVPAGQRAAVGTFGILAILLALAAYSLRGPPR